MLKDKLKDWFFFFFQVSDHFLIQIFFLSSFRMSTVYDVYWVFGTCWVHLGIWYRRRVKTKEARVFGWHWWPCRGAWPYTWCTWFGLFSTGGCPPVWWLPTRSHAVSGPVILVRCLLVDGAEVVSRSCFPVLFVFACLLRKSVIFVVRIVYRLLDLQLFTKKKAFYLMFWTKVHLSLWDIVWNEKSDKFLNETIASAFDFPSREYSVSLTASLFVFVQCLS